MFKIAVGVGGSVLGPRADQGDKQKMCRKADARRPGMLYAGALYAAATRTDTETVPAVPYTDGDGRGGFAVTGRICRHRDYFDAAQDSEHTLDRRQAKDMP